MAVRRRPPATSSQKIRALRALTPIVRRLKQRGKKIVFANGCFDLLHVGHVTLLEHAKRLGDILIVALNSDASVRGLKGPSRPMVPQAERARVMAALACVDFVTIFNEPTPLRVIESLVPDILVKGSDWGEGNIVGRDVVERAGGRVVRVKLVEGHSTTTLIERILRATASGISGPSCGCG